MAEPFESKESIFADALEISSAAERAAFLEANAGLQKTTGDVNGRWTRTNLQRLVELYEKSDQKDRADDWRKKLEDFKKR